MTAARQARGKTAEDYVARRLEAWGFDLVQRNARTPGTRGEVDIIARDGRALVFVEVKARSNGAVGGPETPLLAVGARKQAQLRRLAVAWLSARPSGAGGFAELRFDVAGVWIGPGDVVTDWEYVRAAF